jgi:hypothetical protein
VELVSHFKARRKEKIDSILSERANLLGDRMETCSSADASTTASVFSQSLDEMATKEAKRISNFIQAQIRRKAYAERVFLERLEKKEALRAKLEKLERRAEQAEALREQKSSELKEISETRFNLRDQLLSIEKEKREARLEEMMEKQSQQSITVEQFLKLKGERQTATSELWEAKLREIADRAAEHQASLKRKGEEVLIKKKQKTNKVIERKSKHIRIQKLKGEETTLRVLDALDRKRQLERRTAQKREQIGEIIQQDLQKAHFIELTRERMISKRKHLLSLRAKDSVSVEPTPLPGPTDYDLPQNSLSETPGGFISLIKPKLTIPGTIDFEASKQVPGPGYYTVELDDHSPVVPWSTSKKTTFVEEENKAKIDIPGPASYELPSPRNDKGVNLRRDLIPKDLLTQKETLPGPGTYTVDDFTRQEAVRKKFDGGTFYTRKISELAPVIEEPDMNMTDMLLDI